MTKSTSKRRTKGEGSIAVMPNGKLRMTITIGRGIDGKQKRKVVTASTRQELLDKTAEVRLKYKVGNYKDLLNVNITFEEYAKKWLDKKSYSSAFNTISSHKYLLSRCKYLYDIQLVKITNEDINTMLLSMKDVAPSTVLLCKKFLSSIFNSAVDEELILKSPMRGVISPAKRQIKADLVIPTEEKVKEMLKVAKEWSEGTDKKHFKAVLYPFLLLAVTSGMRRGELAGLKWNNIDYKTNKIKIDSQMTSEGTTGFLKTESSYRTIAVAPEVLEVLKGIPKVNDTFVFMLKHNSSYALLSSINKVVKELFVHLKLDNRITLHTLRHFHATQLIKHGVNVKVVSKRLGHSNIQTTLDIYVHWLPSMDEEASLIVGKNYVLI